VKRRKPVRDVVRQLLRSSGSVTAAAVAAKAGVSRQAAHAALVRLVEEGGLEVEGRARATRYRRSPSQPIRLATAGLAEDRVLDDIERRMPDLAALGEEARRVFGYAFLEILNNALEHSGSEEVDIRIDLGGGRMGFEIVDHGVGAWANLRSGLGFESDLVAIQELSKGKVTTLPSRHTGEGVFFVSKAGDLFEMESGDLCWVVDAGRQDTAILASAPRQGTRVLFSASVGAVRPLDELFRSYTGEDHAFSRTRAYVQLFALGLRFLSRSEARRMMRGMERFREVVLDFHRVPGVGQGFADEVFRVWARDHPGVRLRPVRMNPPVELMVERARAAARE
jgi:hypothetical protein